MPDVTFNQEGASIDRSPMGNTHSKFSYYSFGDRHSSKALAEEADRVVENLPHDSELRDPLSHLHDLLKDGKLSAAKVFIKSNAALFASRTMTAIVSGALAEFILSAL